MMTLVATCKIKDCFNYPVHFHGYCAEHAYLDRLVAASPPEPEFKQVGDLPAFVKVADVAMPHVEMETDGTMYITMPKIKQMVDPVVEANRKMLLDRSQLGIKKYGTTLAGNQLSHREWLQHALEEALDLANYLQAEIMKIDAEEADHKNIK